MVCRYTVVTVSVMLPFITTALAEGTDEPVEVEQTVKPDGNREEAIQSTPDVPTEKMSENDEIIVAKLKEQINFTLVGTILSDTGKPVAIIEDHRTNEQKFYRLNDGIIGGRIIEIFKDKIVLAKDGVKVEVKLNSGTSNNIEAASTKTAKVEDLSHAPEFSLPVTSLDDEGLKVDEVGTAPADILLNDILLNASHTPELSPPVGGGLKVDTPADILLNELRLKTGDVILNDGTKDTLNVKIDD